jgi:hypothetical protein
VSAAESTPPVSGRGFMLGAFVVAAVIGIAVAYFGITGQLGGPIP